MALPGSSAAPAVDRRRDDFAFESGHAVLRLIEALEEQDDVQAVYSNYDIPDEVFDAISAA